LPFPQAREARSPPPATHGATAADLAQRGSLSLSQRAMADSVEHSRASATAEAAEPAVDRLTADFDVLENVLAALRGVEALRAASTCSSFASALAAQHLWEGYYQREFAHRGFEFSNTNPHERYRLAHGRSTLRHAEWVRGGLAPGEERSSGYAVSGSAGPRQGATSCALSLAGGCVAVYGGWTNVGIRRDLHILSPTTEGEWGWSQVPLWSPRQGPARAAYGPSITACEDADGSARLLVVGGTTAGGYRGITGSLHTIRLRVDDPPARFEAEWEPEACHDGPPRAYHTCALLAGGHADHTGKLWAFGGVDEQTDIG